MTISLAIVCTILLVLLGVSAWYIRGLLVLMYQLTSDIQTMQDELEEFSKHLDNVYEMEMYYGDEHLQSLIDQSRELINTFIETQEKYFDVEVEDLEYDDTNKEEETATPEE